MAGLVATALYTANLSPVVTLAAFAVIGVGTVWATFTGPRRFGAEPRGAWTLIGAAALCFLIGVVVRPFVVELPLPWPLLADAATIPGYVLTAIFLFVLLRSRQSVERHAVLDGLIVCLAGGLICALLLAAPAAALPGRPPLIAFLSGMYPLFDVVLLLLVVNLTFTATTWPVSLVTFLATMTLMFGGDLAYAIIGLSGEPVRLAAARPAVPAGVHAVRGHRAASVGGPAEPGRAPAGAGLVVAADGAARPGRGEPVRAAGGGRRPLAGISADHRRRRAR